jgi:integration host factor subunit beta
MGTVTKKDLIDQVTEKTQLKRAVVRDVVHELLARVISELAAGHRLEFRDFGVFEVKARKARRAQNPRTLEPVRVPPKHTVKFKAGRMLREELDKLNRLAEAELAQLQPPEPVATVNGTLNGTHAGTVHGSLNGTWTRNPRGGSTARTA